MPILILGLNHRTTPVEIREQLSFSQADQPQALAGLIGEYGLREAAIVSTCNRSELYLVGDQLGGARRFLADRRGIDVEALHSHFYELRDTEAARHLFQVSCGIDSLVIGESQILNQVRQALELAQRHGAAGRLLNELFQRALHVGKRARTETDIGHGHLSIGSAAVELAGQLYQELAGRSALLIGAGEMAELTARHLLDNQLHRLWIVNRTWERAAELARRFSAQATPFEELSTCLAEVDIVISSTAAAGFVILPEMLRQTMRQRRGRPLFLIDIAVPRDIDPQVRDLDNVFLFDIDDLQQVVEANRAEREAEIDKVERLIDQELAAFVDWSNALHIGPLIRSLHRRVETLRQAELDRWHGKIAHLSAADRKMIDDILRGYANKLLHIPLVQLRELATRQDGPVYLAAVRRLFALEADEDSAM